MPELDYFLATRPMDKSKPCGDTGIIKEFDSKVFIGLVDIAGHGETVSKAVLLCKDFPEKKKRQKV